MGGDKCRKSDPSNAGSAAESNLIRAIRRGTEVDGDLVRELCALSDDTVKTAEEAAAICSTLDKLLGRVLHHGDERACRNLAALVGLFESVVKREAIYVLQEFGLPTLYAAFDHALSCSRLDADDLLLVLKVFSIYGTKEGARRVIRAAKLGIASNRMLWSVILEKFDAEHPQALAVLEALRQPLPPDSLGVAYLELANRLLAKPISSIPVDQDRPGIASAEAPVPNDSPKDYPGNSLDDAPDASETAGSGTDDKSTDKESIGNRAAAGFEVPHPFDSTTGLDHLIHWVRQSEGPQAQRAAYVAASTLPFLQPSRRRELLALCLDHYCPLVQIEAAAAAVGLGNRSAHKLLTRWCRDARFARFAKKKLKSLAMEADIPEECEAPDFLAMSEMCQWLSHPQEFGRPPDRIEMLDTRVLFWPPSDDLRQVWLFSYHYDSDCGHELEEGVGMVGSVTCALVGETTCELPARDVYALHCCWELQQNGDARAPKRRSIKAGRALVQKHNRTM